VFKKDGSLNYNASFFLGKVVRVKRKKKKNSVKKTSDTMEEDVEKVGQVKMKRKREKKNSYKKKRNSDGERDGC
jgi:hypothetical protein